MLNLPDVSSPTADSYVSPEAFKGYSQGMGWAAVVVCEAKVAPRTHSEWLLPPRLLRKRIPALSGHSGL